MKAEISTVNRKTKKTKKVRRMMNEFIRLCLPMMAPALAILAIAAAGRVFRIKKITESHRF